MRLFHYAYHEAVENLGVNPDEFVKLLDECEFRALTPKDTAHLAILLEMACEFYGITEEGWEEWR